MADQLHFNTAPGVAYTAFPGLAKPLFRCGPHEATISVPACAAWHVEAQTAKGPRADRLAPCRSCAIGAAHAGQALVHYSALFGSMICPRCGHGTTRMIRKRKCVNCYNRQREYVAGRNAKGTAPTKMRALHQVEVRFTVDGAPHRFRSRHATGTPEAVAHVLRTTKGVIHFGFHGRGHNLRQGILL